MKRIMLPWAAIALFTTAVVSGCGGGGEDRTATGDSAAPSTNNPGTIVNLKEGGFVGASGAGIYFPPQEVDASIYVVVNGSGESEGDPLSVDISFADVSGAIKAGKADAGASTNIFFNAVLNQTTAQTPGTYGSIGGVLLSGGAMYGCSGSYPSSGTAVEGAILGPDGRQYVGCVEMEMYDEFKANFFINANSVSDAASDLQSNIRAVGRLCQDNDCGDLAEPIDMMDLYGAYSGEFDFVNPAQLQRLVDSHSGYTNTFLIGDIRRSAYENMLFELFTQKYLWKDYQDKIEVFSAKGIGLPKWVRDFTDAIEKVSSVTNDGKTFVTLTPGVIQNVRQAFGWSKYATYKNTLDRLGKYLDVISQGATYSIDIEDGLFEWFLYQMLGACFTEDYVDAFEKQMLPNVKDPELRTAFLNTKIKLLGTLPDGSDGLLRNDVMQIFEAMKDTGIALTWDYLKINLAVVMTKYISTGIGEAASASGGLISSAGPGILAGALVAALDDGVRFSTMDAPLLIALSTFIHNNYSGFELFNDTCPASDGEEENLLLAQNMFYGARLFFSLLQENYERWFVEASSLRQDIFQWVFNQAGFGNDGTLWTLPRKDAVSKGEIGYAAKAVKAMEMLFTCEGDSNSSGADVTMFSYDCSAAPGACTDQWKQANWEELVSKLNALAHDYPQLLPATNPYVILATQSGTNKIDDCGAPYDATGNVSGQTINVILSDDAPFSDVDFQDTVKFIVCHELGHQILPNHVENGLADKPTLDEQIADWFARSVCGYEGEHVRRYNATSDKSSLCTMDPRADSAISGTDCEGAQCGSCCFYFNSTCRGAMTVYWTSLLTSLDDYLAIDDYCIAHPDCNLYEEAAKRAGAAGYAASLADWRSDALVCSGDPTCTNECASGQTKCAAGRVYGCVLNSSGCFVWDAGTACAAGLCAADGLKCDTCLNECSSGEVKCATGKSYACTTDTQGCRVWGAGAVCPAGSCSDATHCAGCTPHNHNACYDHDVYSYDSCNMVENKVAECGTSDWTGAVNCISGDVYQSYVTKDCSGTACTSTTQSKMKQDCGNAGCSGGVCCASHASSKCYSDDVYWYSSCSVRQDKKEECGGSTPSGSNYCLNDDVYRVYDVGICAADHCTTTKQEQKQAECGASGCLNGQCCISHTTKQCSNNDVYWYDSCGKNEGIAIDCDATQTCSTDKCLCPSSAPWTSNALTATTVSGGISLSWNPAPSSWIHHYKVARAPGAITPPPGLAVSPDLTGTSWVDTTGVSGQQYTYLVYGYDACGANRNVSTMLSKVFP